MKFLCSNIFAGHGDPRKLNKRNVCCRRIFVRLIFVVRLPCENILTMNVSQIVVIILQSIQTLYAMYNPKLRNVLYLIPTKARHGIASHTCSIPFERDSYTVWWRICCTTVYTCTALACKCVKANYHGFIWGVRGGGNWPPPLGSSFPPLEFELCLLWLQGFV